jgi:hypothetical protein
MSTQVWNEIATRVSESRSLAIVHRSSERIKETAEIFTPTDLVIEMVKRLGVDRLKPGSLILDPACGDGQFLVTVKWTKVLYFRMTEESALAEIFGVDVMADNVVACRRRLGGGTIALGDALNPHRHIPGQTDDDRMMLSKIFGQAERLPLFN